MEVYDLNGNILYDDMYNEKIIPPSTWTLKEISAVPIDKKIIGFVKVKDRVLELLSH